MMWVRDHLTEFLCNNPLKAASGLYGGGPLSSDTADCSGCDGDLDSDSGLHVPVLRTAFWYQHPAQQSALPLSDTAQICTARFSTVQAGTSLLRTTQLSCSFLVGVFPPAAQLLPNLFLVYGHSCFQVLMGLVVAALERVQLGFFFKTTFPSLLLAIVFQSQSGRTNKVLQLSNIAQCYLYTVYAVKTLILNTYCLAFHNNLKTKKKN